MDAVSLEREVNSEEIVLIFPFSHQTDTASARAITVKAIVTAINCFSIGGVFMTVIIPHLDASMHFSFRIFRVDRHFNEGAVRNLTSGRYWGNIG